MLILTQKELFKRDAKQKNWEQIKRGVPLSNGANFVRFEKETGFVYDDLGGYLHHANCQIDLRREISWIEYSEKESLPVNPNDKILIETHNHHFRLLIARLVNWKEVARYRVIKKFL